MLGGVRWIIAVFLGILLCCFQGAVVAEDISAIKSSSRNEARIDLAITPPPKKQRQWYTTDSNPPRTPPRVIKTPGGSQGETPGGSGWVLKTRLGRNKKGSTWADKGIDEAGVKAQVNLNQGRDRDVK